MWLQSETARIVARMLREVRASAGDGLAGISDADLLGLIEEMLVEIHQKDE